MKKVFLALLVTSIFSACTKDKAEPAITTPPGKKLMSTKNVTTNSDLRTYTYDSQGRLAKVESATHAWTFAYFASKLTVTAQLVSSGALLSTQEHTLDAAGKTTMSLFKTPAGEVSYTRYLTYDAQGYLVNDRFVYADGEVQESTYTISGGNAVKEVYKQNGIIEDITDYTYETSIPAKLYFTMASSWIINDLFGKGYTNELKSYKRYNLGGVLESEKISSYILNSDGYVIRRTDTYPITGQTYEYEFTYQ